MFDSVHCSVYGPAIALAETIRKESSGQSRVSASRFAWSPGSSPEFTAAARPTPEIGGFRLWNVFQVTAT
jgi:hypothetical protein